MLWWCYFQNNKKSEIEQSTTQHSYQPNFHFSNFGGFYIFFRAVIIKENLPFSPMDKRKPIHYWYFPTCKCEQTLQEGINWILLSKFFHLRVLWDLIYLGTGLSRGMNPTCIYQKLALWNVSEAYVKKWQRLSLVHCFWHSR